MKVLHCVGARPNFMKMAPVLSAMDGGFEQVLIHTGQHYDDRMARVFFDELGLPRPDADLGVGSLPRLEQIAAVRQALAAVLEEARPDLVMVYGDVNSTLACAWAADDAGIQVAHVEAGLRSFDETMPEEVNRVLTDRVSALLFTHSPEAADNLASEGATGEVHMVGNTMIDTLVRLLPRAEERTIAEDLGLPEVFALATFHRPSNVDDPGSLEELMSCLRSAAERMPVVWPVHPRLGDRVGAAIPGLIAVEPLGYVDFLSLERRASVVLTDSGGVQEETTFLGVPCLTIRPNTERPVTISHGTNRLVERSAAAVERALEEALSGAGPEEPPELWDGHAAERIASVLEARAG